MFIENIRRVMRDGICFENRLLEWGKIPKLTDLEDITREYKGYKFERRYRLSLDSRNNSR